MAYNPIIGSMLLTLALGAGPSIVTAAPPHDHDGRASDAALPLNQGRKWQTDAPLREGMEHIRAQLSAAQEAVQTKRMSEAQFRALALDIEYHVGYIVKNCRLAPDADAQLHVVLGSILQGTAALKANGDREQGVRQIAQALDRYGEHFAHPNWPRPAVR